MNEPISLPKPKEDIYTSMVDLEQFHTEWSPEISSVNMLKELVLVCEDNHLRLEKFKLIFILGQILKNKLW